MPSIYKSVRTIVQEMCDDFKSITGITLTPDMKDNTHVIKFYTDAGALSAMYAKAEKVRNDIHPQTSSDEALARHLVARGLPPKIAAQGANGQITLTFTDTQTLIVGTQVKRASNGKIYQSIEVISRTGAGTASGYFTAVDAGNDTNIDEDGEPFELVTPVANVNTACVSSTPFLDGRDEETPAEIVARILEHDQDDNTGGNAVAYEAWAKAASAEVVTAKALRLVRGPDTVDVIITSGTTDIDAAVENGQTVSRLPSAPLVATVQAYIEGLNPVTDDVLVLAPTELNFNSTIKYKLYDNSAANRSYVDGEITKVWKAYVYKARSGDVLSPTVLERLIDQRIGDLIEEREVQDFGISTTFYTVPNDKILNPNTLTLQDF